MKMKDSNKKDFYNEQYQFRGRLIYIQTLKHWSALKSKDPNPLPIKKYQALILFKKKVLTNYYKC